MTDANANANATDTDKEIWSAIWLDKEQRDEFKLLKRKMVHISP